jgi:hypothetical protein
MGNLKNEGEIGFKKVGPPAIKEQIKKSRYADKCKYNI